MLLALFSHPGFQNVVYESWQQLQQQLLLLLLLQAAVLLQRCWSLLQCHWSLDIQAVGCCSRPGRWVYLHPPFPLLLLRCTHPLLPWGCPLLLPRAHQRPIPAGDSSNRQSTIIHMNKPVCAGENSPLRLKQRADRQTDGPPLTASPPHCKTTRSI